jgi:hypothetical protein
MGETKEQIIDQVAHARGALDEDLNALAAGIKQKTDIRVQVERHPWALAAMVIGSGPFLGKIFAALSGE